jgi:hypothetical protein
LAIDTFITELSRVIRNWADASVSNTAPAAALARPVVTPTHLSGLLGRPGPVADLRRRRPPL